MQILPKQVKNIIGLMLFVFVLTIVPIDVFAQNLGLDLVSGVADNAGFDANVSETTLATTIGSIIRIALSFVGVIFTVLAVYAGFLWMTARGNDTQVENAQKTLQNAVIGIIIAVGAYAITGFVMRAIETTSVNTSPPESSGEETDG